MVDWYPQDKRELSKLIDSYFEIKISYKSKIHGVISPHAGYEFSGKIAGKAFSLVKNKNFKKAIVLGPSHQFGFYGIAKLPNIKTPLGDVKIIKSNIKEIHGLEYEHSIDNQIPFLQKLGISEVLPIVVGNLHERDSKDLAERISKSINKETILVVSTDLSHFLDYDEAIKKDKKTISAIENLEADYFLKEENSACGIFPLLILVNLCKIKNWKPRLIEYKNSGDISGDKTSVVGYGAFVF